MGLSSLSDDQNQQKDMADQFILCPVPPYPLYFSNAFPSDMHILQNFVRPITDHFNVQTAAAEIHAQRSMES